MLLIEPVPWSRGPATISAKWRATCASCSFGLFEQSTLPSAVTKRTPFCYLSRESANFRILSSLMIFPVPSSRNVYCCHAWSVLHTGCGSSPPDLGCKLVATQFHCNVIHIPVMEEWTQRYWFRVTCTSGTFATIQCWVATTKAPGPSQRCTVSRWELTAGGMRLTDECKISVNLAQP